PEVQGLPRRLRALRGDLPARHGARHADLAPRRAAAEAQATAALGPASRLPGALSRLGGRYGAPFPLPSRSSRASTLGLSRMIRRRRRPAIRGSCSPRETSTAAPSSSPTVRVVGLRGSSAPWICPSSSTRAPPLPGSKRISKRLSGPATSGGQTPPWGASGV